MQDLSAGWKVQEESSQEQMSCTGVCCSRGRLGMWARMSWDSRAASSLQSSATCRTPPSTPKLSEPEQSLQTCAPSVKLHVPVRRKYVSGFLPGVTQVDWKPIWPHENVAQMDQAQVPLALHHALVEGMWGVWGGSRFLGEKDK